MKHKEQEEMDTEVPQNQIAQNQWQRENVQKRTQETYGNKDEEGSSSVHANYEP